MTWMKSLACFASLSLAAGAIAVAATDTSAPAVANLSTNATASLTADNGFGNTGAQSVLRSERAGGRGLRGTQAIVRHTPGSGANGPQDADFALMVSARKNNFETATGGNAIEGEIDPLYVINQQGKKGDAAGALFSVSKRRDTLTRMAPDETGSALGAEFRVSLFNQKRTEPYYQINFIPSFAQSPNGSSRGYGYGAYAIANIGTAGSAFHAEAADGARWQNVLTNSTCRLDPSCVNFAIASDGRIFQGRGLPRGKQPARQVRTGFDEATDSWRIQDEKDQPILTVNRSSRVVTAGGGLQVGGGSVLTFAKGGRVNGAIPALPNFKVGVLARVTALAGAQPGDLVWASIVSPDPALAPFRVFGVVTAPDTVELRVQNLTGAATSAPRPVTVAVKVERFG